MDLRLQFFWTLLLHVCLTEISTANITGTVTRTVSSEPSTSTPRRRYGDAQIGSAEEYEMFTCPDDWKKYVRTNDGILCLHSKRAYLHHRKTHLICRLPEPHHSYVGKKFPNFQKCKEFALRKSADLFASDHTLPRCTSARSPGQYVCQIGVFCYLVDETNSRKICMFRECPQDEAVIELNCALYEAMLPCASNPCLNHGDCYNSVDKFGNSFFKCVCHDVGQDPKNRCQECKHPTWGQNCTRRCGACDYGTASVAPPCSPKTGCPGCVEGVYSPPTCTQVDCDIAVCRHNGVCMRDLQRCSCPPHKSGVLCMENTKDTLPCDARIPGHYRRCYNGGICIIDLALRRPYCVCQKPWAGPFCKDSCLEKSENCLHGVCNPRTKLCGQCHQGYHGRYCDTPCEDGTYGDCSSPCGRCLEFPCNFRTGHCKRNACQAGYIPPTCHLFDTSIDRMWVPMAGEFKLQASSLQLTAEAEDDIKELTEAFVVKQVQAMTFEVQIEVVSISTRPGRNVSTVGLAREGRDLDQHFHQQKEVQLDSHGLHRRQAGRKLKTIVTVEYTILVGNMQDSQRQFIKDLTQRMKQNSEAFDDSGKYQVIPQSVQLTSLLTDASEETKSSSVSSTRLYTLAAILGLSSLAIVVVVCVMVVSNNRRKLQGKKRRTYAAVESSRRLS